MTERLICQNTQVLFQYSVSINQPTFPINLITFQNSLCYHFKMNTIVIPCDYKEDIMLQIQEVALHNQ